MLALEHSRRQQFMDQGYDLEHSIQAPYPGLTMDAYENIDPMINFHPLPYSFFENPSMFSTAPMQPAKPEMGQLHEMPPALISSGSAPSIPSASSSTVGSPYSGPSHTISSQDGYDHAGASYGLGVMPTIVNHEAFSHELLGTSLEAELSLAGHDKLADSFVGECADLSSSQPRLSTVARPNSQSVQPPSSFPSTSQSSGQCLLSLTASPEVLSISTVFDHNAGSTAPSVAATSVFSSVAHSPCTDQTHPTPIFKSPTTPASARVGTSSTVLSPVDARSIPPTSRSQTGSLFPNHLVAHETHATPPHPKPARHFQSHFFAQSSGSFMPPLESSYPSLIHAPRPYAESVYPDHGLFAPSMHTFTNTSPLGSPAPSPQPYGLYPTAQFADPLANPNYFQQQQQPQQPHLLSRRPSLASYGSGVSHSSPASELDEEGREKGRCPHPECGKVFKDLKAHMLTHQSERPEKCPILTCEYNQKGFARKYDKNRHTLTHYKGTMVCGFCPGSGSSAEKSFNRADVFKRHLTSVHGVEQTPPNSRKRNSPSTSTRKLSSYCQDATGKCSTCSATFNNAQDFYEHLDDCVLRVVQQEEPSEAINIQHLSTMTADKNVQETLDRHMIKTEDVSSSFDDVDDDEDDDEEDEDDDEDEDPSFSGRSGKGAIKSNKASGSGRAIIGGGVSKPGKSSTKKGMTWSKGGVALVGKGRKKRKHYPPSWGMAAEKMRMKKRVICVYDGERRLLKDDMMLHNEFEVRMMLPDGKNYVTDLDVETMKRAEAFHNASQAEKGPWIPTSDCDVQGFDLNTLMA